MYRDIWRRLADAMNPSAVAGWNTVIGIDSVLLAFLFSAAIGIIFGLWPARKADALDPILAPRYE